MSIPIIRTPLACFEKIPLPGWTFGKPMYFTSKLFNSSIRIAYWIVDPQGKEPKETIKEKIVLVN